MINVYQERLEFIGDAILDHIVVQGTHEPVYV